MDTLDRELILLEEQLRDGVITTKEYNEQAGDLEREMRSIQGEEAAWREDFNRTYGY